MRLTSLDSQPTTRRTRKESIASSDECQETIESTEGRRPETEDRNRTPSPEHRTQGEEEVPDCSQAFIEIYVTPCAASAARLRSP